MRMDEYLRFRGIVKSLTDSTYLKVVGEKFSAEFFGRCSVYISHQGVEFGPGHGVQGLFTFRNTYGFLAILPTRSEEHTSELQSH